MIMDNIDDVFNEDLNLELDDVVSNNNDDDNLSIIDNNNSSNDLFKSDVPEVLNKLLQERGVVDSKIKILDDESEEETEVNFFELPEEEQLAILRDDNPSNIDSNIDNAPKIEGDELELFNYLRENELSLEEYLENYKSEALKEFEDNTSVYDIDNYDDKELFLLDLKTKYDLTDEELEKELSNALNDEELFNKKINKTREEYKQLEDQYKKDQQVDFEKSQQEQYSKFSDTMVDVAINTSDYYGIELEDSEKNNVLQDLLELDEDGNNSFYKELNDPNKLFEAAWFIRYGKDAFKALHDAYEEEISKIKKDKKDKKDVVIRQPERNKEPSIHDLNF